jgi:hypothetical protein
MRNFNFEEQFGTSSLEAMLAAHRLPLHERQAIPINTVNEFVPFVWCCRLPETSVSHFDGFGFSYFISTRTISELFNVKAV